MSLLENPILSKERGKMSDHEITVITNLLRAGNVGSASEAIETASDKQMAVLLLEMAVENGICTSEIQGQVKKMMEGERG
jgi:hypothetical protein